MEEKTADEIAAIFSAAGDSVTLINADANYAAYVTRTSGDAIQPDAMEAQQMAQPLGPNNLQSLLGE